MEIYFKHDHKCFNLQVAAVIKKEDKFLISKHDKLYTLPGGRVQFNETTEKSIKRHVLEDFNIQVKITKLLSINENFFDYSEDLYHELLLVYLCEVEEDIIDAEIDEERFKFVSFQDMIDLNFKPKVLLSDLKKISKEITHNVIK